ncbi:hypothetical protein SAMN05421813_13155 [Daejeonella rubra]|uniref:Uncharacterized protein n=1 Tax=Daejeonella rubra TaxID=990371 RepID=A0A1G9XNQ3_9SPHI|nr:hypothetical protein SAMN05421813_13155 [Daejeonella rubra]
MVIHLQKDESGRRKGVWYEGLSEWTTADQIEDLKDYI